MTAASGELGMWPKRQWWGVVTLVFIGQLMIIFWLGDREPIHPRVAVPGPKLHLIEGQSSELLALTDPTLFALPHPQGFSGLAWLRSPEPDFRPFAWSEPAHWLQLPASLFGAALGSFTVSNSPNPLLALTQPEAELRVPQLQRVQDFPQNSTLRLTGDLAKRRLLSRIELPSWQWSVILTNTEIQMAIDAAGKPEFVTMLYPGSGYADADSNAYWQATRARFAPLNSRELEVTDPISQLKRGEVSWGEMIFEWHTEPLPSTNAAGPIK